MSVEQATKELEKTEEAKIRRIKAEMGKVKAASLGEVILFTDPENFVALMGYPPIDNPPGPEEPIFKAVLGIYRGVEEICGYRLDDERIYSTLKPDHNVRLAVIKIHDVPAPWVCECDEFDNICVMMLSSDSKAYVGPGKIMGILRTKGRGLFDGFFERYVKKYRKLEG